jgi:hypothetical protein
MLDEKEEEGMGQATVQYGETNAFIRHVEREVWLTYQTSEVTKKGLGKVEEKKAIAHSEGMDTWRIGIYEILANPPKLKLAHKCV